MKSLRISHVAGLGFVVLLSLAPPYAASAVSGGVAPRPDKPVELPAEASAGWWDTVQRNIRAEEYELSWVGAAGEASPAGDTWSAPNRAHGFRASFSAAGLNVTPVGAGDAADGAPGWEWGLALAGWGRPGTLTAPDSRVGTASKNRFEIWAPGLTEWYVNDERGIEQGFGIAARPDGLGPLAIELALSGNLRPVFAEDGQAVDFYDGGNISVIHYASLKVTDATGRSLPARLEGFASSSFAIRHSPFGIRHSCGWHPHRGG